MINFKNSLLEEIHHYESSKIFFNNNDDNKGNLINNFSLINIFNEFYPEEILYREKDLPSNLGLPLQQYYEQSKKFF